MNTIEKRTAEVKKARQAVQDHCMCARLEETPHQITVWYPEGYFPHGARAATGMGKRLAFERLLVILERHWTENNPFAPSS